MNNNNKDFQKESKRFNIIFYLVAIILVIISAIQISAVGYFSYKVVRAFETADAKDIARELGETVKAFNEAKD